MLSVTKAASCRASQGSRPTRDRRTLVWAALVWAVLRGYTRANVRSLLACAGRIQRAPAAVPRRRPARAEPALQRRADLGAGLCAAGRVRDSAGRPPSGIGPLVDDPLELVPAA